MQRVILVVSPDTEFLQQLRSHLEEGGRYQVTVALSAHEALNLANSNFFEVAIVDGELDDIPVAAFTRDLTALQSDLKILVFPPDNNPQHPVLDGLSVNGYLSKPFSGQEIGKALSSLFSDQPLPNNVQVKVIDDLVKQWLQIPETGGRKAEQILKATTSQTVLIIIKDQLIASAGSMDDGLVHNVTGFLSRYWKDEENSELARYIKLDGDGSNRFLYTTKLVSNVVLVMVYPMNATIQMVRRELKKVKDNFQQTYPTTGELRQDIAKQTLVEINTRNKKLESLQTNANTFSQSDIDVLDQMEVSTQNTPSTEVTQAEIEARKLFEQESVKPKPTIAAISQEEIDLLKALQDSPQPPAVDAVSQAELEARKLFEQESVKPKPTIAAISQEEIDLLKALQDSPQPPAVDAVSQAELEARKLFEQESVKPKPTIAAISQEEIDLLKAMQNEPAPPAVDAVSQAELEARKLFEQESVKPKPSIAAISQEEIDLLKALQNEPAPPAVDAVSQAELEARKLFEQESVKPKPTIAAISQEEIDLLKALQDSPQPTAVDAVSQAELEARKLFEQESVKPKPSIAAISQEEIDLLKAMQNEPAPPAVDAVSQAELEARKLFEQESVKPKPSIAAISQEEIDLLKALQNEPASPAVDAVSQAELEARKLFEQESVKPKPTIAAISQEEIDLLKAMQNEPASPAMDTVSQAELEARKLFEQESIKPKPAINGISQEEIDLLKAMQETNSQPQANNLSETEMAARKLFEQESLNKATIAANDVSQTDLDALGQVEQESLKAEAANPSNISEQELAELTKLLDQMPAPDPQPGAETTIEEKKLPEWLNELETADNATMAQPANNTQPHPAENSIPAGIPPFLGIDDNLKSAIEKGEPLPEIDFKLPWEDEEIVVQVSAEIAVAQAVEPKSDEILEPVIDQPVQVAEPVVQTELEALQPATASFAEVLETVTPQVETSAETMPAIVESPALTVPESLETEEPETPSAPPSLKDFRFNYTLVLMPGDHNQFLTKNLSDKLSAIMPDIHEDQGWKMTSITIRPQYLLWTVAVRLGICPNQIMQEVRNLTSNSIFANFPEIAKVKTSNDFWSTHYLAVSGSEPPPANLIFDFVNDAWKTPEAAAL